MLQNVDVDEREWDKKRILKKVSKIIIEENKECMCRVIRRIIESRRTKGKINGCLTGNKKKRLIDKKFIAITFYK